MVNLKCCSVDFGYFVGACKSRLRRLDIDGAQGLHGLATHIVCEALISPAKVCDCVALKKLVDDGILIAWCLYWQFSR